MSRHHRLLTATMLGAVGALTVFMTGQGVALAAPYGGTAENGWLTPVPIASTSGAGEPTIIHDSANRLFVTYPQALGNVTTGGSPVFTSLDGGDSWSAPVRAVECAVASGGDTDMVVDSNDNIYHTDLWLGNSCISVSTDHGQSFPYGDPYGQELQPGDDRPWLAYGSSANEVFGTYDGLNALHITNTAPLVNPALGIQAIGDNIVIPEVLVSTTGEPNTVRECVCPPGGVAVDNSNGPHKGRVYVSFSHQVGTAIGYSDPICAAACVPASWSYGFIQDATSGSAFQDEWNFDPIKVDSNGTVYVMWAHAPSFNGSTAGSSGVQEYYAYSKDGGATWSSPVLLSTEDGTSGSGGTTTFPTMDVVSPGVIDVAWYGTTATGDPNTVPTTASWNVYYTKVTNADTSTPTVPTPKIAIAGMHTGCIQTGGGASCGDRSLLDFFTIINDTCNQPDIIYTGGDLSAGTQLYFTRLGKACVASTGPGTGVPEVPLTPLLLVAGVAAPAVWLGRRRVGRTVS